MPQIHAHPFRIDAAGAERMEAALRAELATGKDLGPRHAQIRSLGLSLRADLLRLRMLEVPPEAEAVMAELVARLEHLSHIASTYAIEAPA